jgi:radical SAM protein with 4Fe4S-binding SPASM domain
MKISKDECDKEFSDQKLILSDEKCKKCEYLYVCPYMAQAMAEVVYGD